MHAWVLEAVAFLSSDGQEPEVTSGLRRWQRDADGLFRDRERTVRVWRRADVDATRRLPTWQPVEDVLRGDERLNIQMDTLVGTDQGASLLGAEQVGRCVLPLPDEVDDLESAFARRYGQLDRFLAAAEIELLVTWPIPGLTSAVFPITLEPGIELDTLTDGEFAAALNTQVVAPRFPGSQLLAPDQYEQAGLRLRYHLPKTLGEVDYQASALLAQKREEQFQAAAEALAQVLALLFADPVAISGRIGLDADWTIRTGSITFNAAPLTRAQQFRKLHLGEAAAREIIETWRQLRKPALLQRQKALALALRRLSYQAGRERIEDELVDLLVAGEALYLSDGQSTELSFRFALRSAVLSNSERLGMTRREVFDLMRSGYHVRSTIVHGKSPKPKDLVVRGAQVPLLDFVQAIEFVIRDGLRTALNRATDPQSKWPPDWDDLTLPKL
jgi:hypothetical protein